MAEKDRLSVVIKSLRDLEVPISVVTDFDVLNSEKPLRSIFEAVGGDWNSHLVGLAASQERCREGMKPELATDEGEARD